MTTWHAVLFAPSSWVRAVLDFIQRKTGTSGIGVSSTVTQPPASPDRRASNEHRDPGDGQNLKLGLASTLLTRVRDGLSEHSDEMATFAETLAPADGSASPRSSWTRMQAANLDLEELVESTVDRLRQACGEVLSAEQSQLEAYSQKTSAFGRRLNDIPSERLLSHVVAELLSIMQGLRHENEAARNAVAEAQQKLGELTARAAAAEREARMDAMTRLLNRRAFDELHAECHDANQDRGYSLLMLDADHFKSINDRYGHSAGDAVLSLIGQIIRENCRATDHMARWGGEEFAILMPEADEHIAMGIAERLRRKIDSAVLHLGQQRIKFTVSCGIVRSRPGASRSQLLQEADVALYTAKEQGRNRCLMFQEGLEVPQADSVAI